jgi:hypothetical protein
MIEKRKKRNSQKYHLSAHTKEMCHGKTHTKEMCHGKKHNESEAQRKVEITYINDSYKLT